MTPRKAGLALNCALSKQPSGSHHRETDPAMAAENTAPAYFLSSLRHRLHQGERMSFSDARTLLQFCRHSTESIRETALLLLLHPPVEDEPAYYVDLFVSPPGRPPFLPRKAPPELYELAFDLVAALRGLPSSPSLRTSLDRLLRRCPRSALRYLANRRFLLHEPGLYQFPRILTALSGTRAPASRSKIRLFFHHLRENRPDWTEPTTGDLLPLWQNPRTGRKHRLTRGRWLRVGRAVTTPGDEGRSSPIRSELGSFKQFYWGGYGQTSLRYLERLFHLQAREIAAQRDLCRAISARTQRVVLSLHNASLAAIGGWGFEPLREAFPDESRRRAFIQGVMRRAERMEEEDPDAHRALKELWELWRDRLLRPALGGTLREKGLRSRLDPHHGYDHERDVKRVSAFLPDVGSMMTLEVGRHTLMGAIAPHQRTGLAQVLSWASQRLRLWEPGWMQLAAVLSHAQDLLDRGEVPAFVLPWIDKFFISSRRDKDIAYLPALIRWLHARGARPIVLFWEDTAHASRPSFQLALEQMVAEGARFRGIGIFGKDGSRRIDAEAIILSEHSRTDLFALRPNADVHVPRSFDQLLAGLDPCIFQSYDSSWKDNLCFLYFGTQVSPLLSVQTEMESFAPWVIMDGRKEPFGAFFRRTLRRLVLREEASVPDSFWSSYVAWANLG